MAALEGNGAGALNDEEAVEVKMFVLGLEFSLELAGAKENEAAGVGAAGKAPKENPGDWSSGSPPERLTLAKIPEPVDGGGAMGGRWP